jgi:hypothetical protein
VSSTWRIHWDISHCKLSPQSDDYISVDFEMQIPSCATHVNFPLFATLLSIRPLCRITSMSSRLHQSVYVTCVAIAILFAMPTFSEPWMLFSAIWMLDSLQTSNTCISYCGCSTLAQHGSSTLLRSPRLSHWYAMVCSIARRTNYSLSLPMWRLRYLLLKGVEGQPIKAQEHRWP